MADDIYYDMHMDDGSDDYERSKFSKIASLFFKSVVAIVVIGVFAILFFRMWSMQDPPMADDFLVDQTTLSQSAAHSSDKINPQYTGDGWYVDFRTFDSVVLKNHKNSKELTLSTKDYGYDGFQVFSHTLANYYLKNEETGKYDIVNRSEYYSVQNDDEGDLRVFNSYFMPQAGQLELTFRYNSDAINNLYKKYTLSKDDPEPFIYVISDNLNNKYTEYSFTKDKRLNYNFRRLLFTGIDFSNITTLYLDIYYINDVTLSKPYRSMIIYDCNLSLDDADIKVPSKVTSGLTDMPKYYPNKEN